MASPSTISVDDGTLAGTVELVPTLPPGGRRSYVILGRQDSAADKLALSVGARDFTYATAALWISAGERMVLTPEDVLWPLIAQGIFALCDTGVTITVNVQIG